MIVGVHDLAYEDLQIQRHAKEHYPSPPYKVMRALQSLQRQMGGFGDAGFVDYGCGAGRAMIIAAEAGFTNITGIELSPKLLGVCRENIVKYSGRNSAASMVVMEQDATTYIPDKSSTVFFFYVPFSPEAYSKVIANIALSVEKYPRTIYLLDFAWSKIDFSESSYQRIGQVEGINLYKLAVQKEAQRSYRSNIETDRCR
jgi:SAM-dependent methyltransferase